MSSATSRNAGALATSSSRIPCTSVEAALIGVSGLTSQ